MKYRHESSLLILLASAACTLLVMPSLLLARGGGGCFLPDTLIRKADGMEVPISQIQPGNYLLAFTSEGQVVAATVQRVLTHDVDEYCVVRTESIVLHVTPEHPFYVGNGTFKTLEALRVGDGIFIFDGQGLSSQTIRSIEMVRARTAVYNLHTDAPNTFFANGIAVHNKGGGGGGGGSHGGGSFRSGSRSSGGRSGGDGDPRVFFVIMGLFISVIIIVKIMEKKKGGDENLDFVYNPSKVAGKADKTLKLLQFLSKQDPAMAPDSLREQAKVIFLKLQECWQARDYGPMKPRMMPDLYADHCRQIAGMVRNHEINMIDQLKVDRVDLVNVRYPFKEAQREFTALITATALDYYLDDRTRKRLRGDDRSAQFQEFWTFQRQGKVWLLREVEQSRESDVLKEDNFFEQFTDTALDQIYGDTAHKDGAAGPWLEKDVAVKETRVERMLNFLVQTDKIWNRQAMLETVRKVFLELMAAWEAGDAGSVPDDDLFPKLSADLRKQIEANRVAGLTLEFRNLCVRKVELILVRNFNDRRQDEFVARVRAHAQQVVRRQDSVLQQDGDVTPFEQFLTLGRFDGRWKLKEILPPADARDLVAQENLDQDSNLQQLQWYYQHKRAI